MKRTKSLFWIILSVFCLQFAGCDSSSYEHPFQNPSLSVEKRAADLVSKLTLDEKISQMLNKTPGIDRLGIPPYDWWNECLHGIGRTEYKVTVYPQAIGMAAGWDVNAIRQMADYTSEEGRAIYNLAQAKGDYRIYRGLTYWTPNINIFRDPRWGRGQETYGEDPFLTASLGSNFVKGLQGNDKTYLKAAGCAKHFAVHSGPESSRHTYNAVVSNYDLWDTYLPAFKELSDAGVVGFMCAYNAYEGQPCCASDKLMIEILRKDWGFKGYVTSDCGAIDDFYRTHKTHPNSAAASADGIFHGTDVDCGREAYRGLKEAVEKGLTTVEQIDISLRRLFEIRIRLGMFDPADKVPFFKIDSSALEKKAHKDLALKMAQQSLVLLKNDGVLPLKKENIKKIAVLGPNANSPEVQLGNYNGFPSKIITPLAGIKEALPSAEIIHELACNLTDNIVVSKLENGFPKGFSVEFYNNTNLEGKPVYKGQTPNVSFSASDKKAIAEGVNTTEFSSRFIGIFESPVSGQVEFKIAYDDGYRLYIDGKLISESWAEGNRTADYSFNTEKGKKYTVKLEHKQHKGNSKIELSANFRTQIDLQTTVDKVKDADVIVFVGGISPRLEGEEMNVRIPGFYGGDRTSIMLPQIQTDLLQALKSTGKPVVFVSMSGSAVSFPWESQNINAIINSWYGGESIGAALADVLFGKYNPSGRLPVTFYASDSDLPDFEDYNMNNRTYKYFKGKPLYPFGYGLSYTQFNYEWENQPNKEYKSSGTINCTLKITNAGKLSGDEVAQIYIKYPQNNGLPLKELRYFERKHIPEGQTGQIKVSIPVSQLAKWDDKAGKLVVPVGTYSIYAGGNSENEAIIASFDVK
ncbi:MAG: glycoside hydrolase family 3 C-terminal domain-containing protein [Prevotellaceae bacterium]|jgi:beta-glucosidase|nr:glycoside hydrolase family 3 C-terminal domain-containing protein [Prevotellaceae bacterium]